MDPTARFSNRADDYARFRPTYPREVVAAILEGFDRSDVADLGAGTGISSQLLADAGARVYAVEPNAPMRAQIVPSENVIPVDGRAETTSLPSGSIDIVTAFQAYHWFKPNAVFAEIARIVRPRARFAAVWNHRDRDDPTTGEYEAVIDAYDASEGKIDRERRAGTVADDLRHHGWSNIRVVEARHTQPMSREAVVGFVRSVSYVPHEGQAYEAMIRALLAIYDRTVREREFAFTWLTQAYIAERQ